MTNVLTGKKRTLLIIVEILLLAVLFAPVILNVLHPQTAEFALEDWHAEGGVFADGWHIDESASSGRFLYGPYQHLDKGSYRVRIDYESTESQRFYPYARFSNIAYIEGGEAWLPANQTSVEYDFTLTEALEQFELVIEYNGKGEMTVYDLSVTTTPHAAMRTFLTVAFALLILSVLLLHPQMEKNKNCLIALGGIVLLASLPLYVKGIAHGHDLDFHLLRIEGMAKEISLGNLPVRMHSLYMDGYGYPVSIYYGDLLLYLPALLRLAGFPVLTAYKCYVFFVNAVTAVVATYCFEKMFRSRRTALLAALAYTTANYRLVDIYTRAAVGEYTALLFLPVIALAVWRIYTEKPDVLRHGALLAVGMTGVIITHVLSAEMVMIALGICCVLLWRKTFRVQTLATYVLAVMLTLALSLFFLVPFVDYYLSVPANINSTVSSTVMKLQGNGAYVGDYFAFFKGVLGDGDSAAAGFRMALTPGAVLMAALCAAAVLWLNRKAMKAMKLTAVLAVLMLWMASTLFPWNMLAAHSRIGRLLSQIQFPWRYIGLAVLFLSILLGLILQLEEHRKETAALCLALCLLVPVSFVSSYSDDLGVDFAVYNAYDTAELNTSTITAMEYLRAGSSVNDLSNDIQAENAQVELISREGPKMVLACQTGETGGAMEVPMFHYKGYRAEDESGRAFSIADGANQVIRIELPVEYEGTITIDFVEPWYWRAAEAFSLLSAAMLFILLKKKKASSKKSGR